MMDTFTSSVITAVLAGVYASWLFSRENISKSFQNSLLLILGILLILTFFLDL